MCGGMYTTIAGGYRRHAVKPTIPSTNNTRDRSVQLGKLRFTMGVIAFHSGQLEGAEWDRWELHRNALVEAYTLGSEHKHITLYHFLKWHGHILPYGGTLRQSNPLSVGMGESFKPHNYCTLPARVTEFIGEWRTAQATPSDAWLTLAHLHFTQWAMHPYPDGNKRHARLMTVYGCGWFGLNPVCITLAEKPAYLDALRDSDCEALAELFKTHTIEILR